jgi:DGQHR domain-containing protein
MARGWRPLREKEGMILLSRRLAKWQKFEMSVREFLAGIYLDDLIDPDDFGFTKLGGYQLDACGGLEGHFILIDCTSANEPGARGLREKIKDFHNKQPDFQRDVKSRFHGKYKTLHYAICTQDIDIDDSDVEYASQRNIRIIPAENLKEWMKLRSIAAPTLAFQFIEYFVGDKLPIPGSKPYRFPAIRLPFSASDDAGDLYAFTATPDQLLRLGFVYRLEYKNVMGYQRPLKLDKLRKINQFLSEDARNGFPTSILVAFDERPEQRPVFEPISPAGGEIESAELGTLVVPAFYGIAEVIDGQHRLYGYHDFSKGLIYKPALDARQRSDRLLVVAYPDPKGSERPRLFLEINSNQTRISTRQIWSMMANARPNTHMGFIANLVRRLNDDGPLRGQIQIPGISRGARPLNIANVGKGIQDRHLVSDSASFDWNLYEGARDSAGFPTSVPPSVTQKFNDLFRATKESALADWTASRSFLLSNNGVNVLLRIYVEMLKFYRQESRGGKVDTARVKRLLSGTLAKYVLEQTPKRLLRRTSAEAGREEVAAEIMTRIHRRHRGFAALYLSERQHRLRSAQKST